MARFVLREYTPNDSDVLAQDDALIRRWIKEAVEATESQSWYQDFPLKRNEVGRQILDSDGEQSRRFAVAALLHTKHWETEAGRLRATGKNEGEWINPHMHPEWSDVWGRRLRAGEVVCTLIRRALPFTESDLIHLLDWIVIQSPLSTYHTPVTAIAKAVERFLKTQPLTEELRISIRAATAKLRGDYGKDAKRAATALEQLGRDDQRNEHAEVALDRRPVVAGPAGNAAVLSELKVAMKMTPANGPAIATREIGPDHFPLRSDSPLAGEHELLTELFVEVAGTPRYSGPKLADCVAGRKIVKLSDVERGKLVLAACERTIFGLMRPVNHNDSPSWQAHSTAQSCVGSVKALGSSFDRSGLFDFMLYFSTQSSYCRQGLGDITEWVSNRLRAEKDISPFSDGERFVLSLVRTALVDGPPLGSPSADVRRLNDLIGDGAMFFLMPTEEWGIAINREIAALTPELKTLWTALLSHCITATSARPSGKWLKTANELSNQIGVKRVRASLLRWFPLVPAGRTTLGVAAFHGDTRTAGDVIQEENARILRGLLWITPGLKGADEMTRAVSVVGQSAYKKVPGVGPRAVKVGNAAVYALSRMHSPAALGQLAMLKVRVKFGTAQKEIEKAFNAAAVALAIPRDQIEEMGIPTYGLEEVGVYRDTFGDAAVDMRVDGRDVALQWTSAGKPVKSVPASVKKDYKNQYKELQATVKDIAAMIPAQSERLDSMFLLQKRWPAETWRERYLDHPLVGTLARRLIWVSGKTPFAWHEGMLSDVDGKTFILETGAEISLWHPIDHPVAEILSWRNWLERYGIRQPFKQAHRELYLLTDAERHTHTYSNRFASHILRQHQFHALCAARGWKNKLRLMVDDVYPPAQRELPNWDLRAEFWIESIGNDYGTDTNDSGAYLRVATDQVRFYRTGAARNLAHAGGGGYATHAGGAGAAAQSEPIPLDQVPPLVLSEILRDVDLFVGVASVGNDPAWQDGGPGGRYRDYWRSYSFGDLSETAQTRKTVLQTLLPKLSKLRNRWTLTDKFLVIQGELRTYKIHLGSGNILMEPNDQYLCIVPGRSSRSDEKVFLPFEGDGTLSIILSKAFLLAADTKIADPTITRQIKQ